MVSYINAIILYITLIEQYISVFFKNNALSTAFRLKQPFFAKKKTQTLLYTPPMGMGIKDKFTYFIKVRAC